MRLRPTSSLLSLAVLGLVGLLAPPALAADWTAEPAANQFGAGRQDYRYTLNPGGRLEDGVSIANHGSAPLQLPLRATGAWAQLNQDDVTVPPGESVAVP